MTSVPLRDGSVPWRWFGTVGLLVPLAVLACCAVIASLAIGASAVPSRTVIAALLGGDVAARDAAIVLQLRLPRTLLGFGVGAALAVSGTMMQGLFRNPLADPALIGISSGAALAAVAVIVLGVPALAAGMLGPFSLPLAAFLGSVCTTLLVQRIARGGHVQGGQGRTGGTDVATLLLAGIAISAIASAATGYLVFGSDDRQMRDITFWTMGSIGGATWTTVLGLAPFALGAVLAAGRWAGVLDALLLGEREAALLGFRVEPAKRGIVIVAAAAVGASVAVAGVIGFVGLVVPHLVRLMAGAGHGRLLPASALLGGTLLVCADIVARTVVAPAELPIGLVTALLGGPFFLWLLIRRRRELSP
ncbi:ABC transporter permease [Skermanella stibiiresistens SB22]|uniref:ABC transporter permease n=1 Tax=Skermanella stibiiresistens SB22 TaxID=1385369 RepID=W9GW17_9PROT|nr:iron ABC transporter permease [Skermanella stibiiresistens]EWY38014.1 ABC transporter permease [Skermanella stibiiresistens SB22]